MTDTSIDASVDSLNKVIQVLTRIKDSGEVKSRPAEEIQR